MTPLGVKLRQLRQEHNITLKEMAEGIDVSSAYISALEHGKRGVPTWATVQRIITFFNIIWDEAEELQRLVEISDPRVHIKTPGLVPEATEFANELALNIHKLDNRTLDEMMMLLKKNTLHSHAHRIKYEEYY